MDMRHDDSGTNSDLLGDSLSVCVCVDVCQFIIIMIMQWSCMVAPEEFRIVERARDCLEGVVLTWHCLSMFWSSTRWVFDLISGSVVLNRRLEMNQSSIMNHGHGCWLLSVIPESGARCCWNWRLRRTGRGKENNPIRAYRQKREEERNIEIMIIYQLPIYSLGWCVIDF